MEEQKSTELEEITNSEDASDKLTLPTFESSESPKETVTSKGPKSKVFIAAGVVLSVVVVATVIIMSGMLGNGTEVAAQVGGKKILVKTLDSEMAKLALADGGSELTAEMQLQYRSALLDELIAQRLIEDEAARVGVEVTDEEVDAALKSIEDGYGGKESFEEALVNAGHNRESFQSQIRWQLLATALLEQAVPASSLTEEEIEAFYEANLDTFSTAAAKRCSHILYDAADEDKAEKALEEIKSGADFAEIAKSESIDTATAELGGDLGWPSTAYVEEFQAAVDALEPGDEPLLIRSVYGYHIVKVTDERKAGQTSLEDSYEEVVEALLSQKRSLAYSALINDLRETANVEILDEKVKEYLSSQQDNPEDELVVEETESAE